MDGPVSHFGIVPYPYEKSVPVTERAQKMADLIPKEYYAVKPEK